MLIQYSILIVLLIISLLTTVSGLVGGGLTLVRLDEFAQWGSATPASHYFDNKHRSSFYVLSQSSVAISSMGDKIALRFLLGDRSIEYIKNNPSSDKLPERFLLNHLQKLAEEMTANVYLSAFQAKGKSLATTVPEYFINDFYSTDPSIVNKIRIGDKIIVDSPNDTHIVQMKELVIERDNQMITIQSDEIIYLSLMKKEHYVLPPNAPTIRIIKNDYGSSSSLILSLYLLYELKDMVSDYRIAGTGVVDRDGNVYEIAGLEQKVNAAVNEKADVLIVPKANEAEARRLADQYMRVHPLRILGVESLADAYSQLSIISNK